MSSLLQKILSALSLLYIMVPIYDKEVISAMKRQQGALRLFENDFMESLSHVHPIVPGLVWVPVAAYLGHRSLFVVGLPLESFILTALISLFMWTLTEYVLHRFVFHFPAKSDFGKRMVFMFHGLHHDEPDVATRLMMPPFPAFLYISFFVKITYNTNNLE